MAEIMAADFNCNRKGHKTSGVYTHEYGHILFTNRTKTEPYDVLFNYIRNARKKIEIFSPYVSNPLLDVLRTQVSSDVSIRFYSPEYNNKGIFKKLLLHQAKQGWFDLYLYQAGMSHLKAILIDEEILITGSSNYDFVSYFFEEEVIVTTRQIERIVEFQALVGDHYRQNSRQHHPSQINNLSPRFSSRFSAIVLNSAYNILRKMSESR
jgi:cardiolipin synthase